MSDRQLERRFLAQVGVSPKRFPMLRRASSVWRPERGLRPSLTAAALEAGYYDQSHFVRDFRRFAGKFPGESFAAPGENLHVEAASASRRPPIRHALFAARVSLGSAAGDTERDAAARAQLAQALHFVTHHGENEVSLASRGFRLHTFATSELIVARGITSLPHGGVEG